MLLFIIVLVALNGALVFALFNLDAYEFMGIPVVYVIVPIIFVLESICFVSWIIRKGNTEYEEDDVNEDEEDEDEEEHDEEDEHEHGEGAGFVPVFPELDEDEEELVEDEEEELEPLPEEDDDEDDIEEEEEETPPVRNFANNYGRQPKSVRAERAYQAAHFDQSAAVLTKTKQQLRREARHQKIAGKNARRT